VGDDVLDHPLGVFEQSCAQALAECTPKKPVFFVCGNRDFLIGPGFFQHTGVQALAEPCTVRSSAGVLLLSHGDHLCTDDHDYLAFRAQVRSPDWQNTFLAQPLHERMAQARAMRAQSQAKQESMATLPDVNTLACEAALTVHQAHTLVHGHTHRPGHHHMGQGLERRVLSDWQAGGSVCPCPNTPSAPQQDLEGVLQPARLARLKRCCHGLRRVTGPGLVRWRIVAPREQHQLQLTPGLQRCGGAGQLGRNFHAQQSGFGFSLGRGGQGLDPLATLGWG
jgi:UDP-2,3-diacylglucosamine diphosphatase